MSNKLAHFDYITTQIQLPLHLECTFKVTDEIITFHKLIENIPLEQFISKRSYLSTETRGRKKKSRVNILKAILFAFSIRVRSTRDIADLCKHDTRFMFLLDGIEPPSHMTIQNTIQSLKTNIDELLVLINQEIMRQDPTLDPSTVYIDGTKLEAYANKYSFVWKKSIQKFHANVQNKITQTIPLLNEVLMEHQIMLIERQESYSSAHLLDWMQTMKYILAEEGVVLVYGKGRKKDELQRLFDRLEDYYEKLKSYEHHLRMIGEDRNSYSKTDPDATFMRMKEDHMRNGQLKAAYNVQLAVANEYIMAIELYQDRSDFATFIPFMNHFESLYRMYPKRPVADAGYGNYANYRFCLDHKMGLYQKYTFFSKEKERKYQKNPFLKHNFPKDKEGNYECPNNKKLVFQYQAKMRYTKLEAYEDVYRCLDCEGCPLKAKCTTSKHGRTIRINEAYDAMKKKVRENLDSDEGIELRINRSIQVEGVYGVMKEDMKYRRFHRRGKDNARLEITLVAIGMNVRKYHNKKYRVLQ